MKCLGWRRRLAAALLAAGCWTSSIVQAAELNTNLTINGSFESSEPFPGSGPFGSMLLNDWIDADGDGDDNYAYAYSQFYSGFPEPPGGGLNHYTGGFDTEAGGVLIKQSFNVGTGPSGTLIQTGNAVFDLRAYFSSYFAQEDASTVRAVFLDAANTELGQTGIGGLNFVQSIPITNGQRDWAEARQIGQIPVGTATVELQIVASSAEGNHDGYVDLVDFQVTDNPIFPSLDITIDRGTGNVTLRNRTTGALNLSAYSILAVDGALNPIAWDSIADNYDANSGGSVDPVNVWTETSSTPFDLSESGAPGPILGVGRTVSLGEVWLRSPFEDVTFQYVSDGSPVTGSVNFTGSPIVVGDLTADGQINASDWMVLRSNQLANLSGLSPVAAYVRGDLTGDLQNNHADFLLFQDIYDQANGPGAFQAMVQSIPEPGSSWFVTAAAASLMTIRRKRIV